MENILNFRGVCFLQKVKRCYVPDLPQAQLNQRLGSACDNRSVVTLIFNVVDFILFIQLKMVQKRYQPHSKYMYDQYDSVF